MPNEPALPRLGQQQQAEQHCHPEQAAQQVLGAKQQAAALQAQTVPQCVRRCQGGQGVVAVAPPAHLMIPAGEAVVRLGDKATTVSAFVMCVPVAAPHRSHTHTHTPRRRAA